MKIDAMLDSLDAKERSYDNSANGINFTIRKVNLMFFFIVVVWIFFFNKYMIQNPVFFVFNVIMLSLVSVWYVITCHLTNYRVLRNRFSAISFHDYLHYCGIFQAHFLMKIDRNITSSLHIIFSLCARVGRCDVCTDFTNVIKVDVDVNEMPLINI